MTVVDAENKILGRFASRVAEMAKESDEKIHIINSEKVVISGDKEEIVDEYEQRVNRGTRHDGPYFPKRPDKILKRSIRGMLPYKSSEGKEALHRVRTHLGEPEAVDEAEDLDVKEGSELRYKNYVKLGEVSEAVGWKNEVNN